MFDGDPVECPSIFWSSAWTHGCRRLADTCGDHQRKDHASKVILTNTFVSFNISSIILANSLTRDDREIVPDSGVK
jgi:hypothetical protein